MRRVGLIGFGCIAENGHLPAWHAFPGVQVVAVADLSSDRLDRARAVVPDAVLFDSSEELIARADIDTIDICTPPSTHMQLIVAACERGIPDIVSEKPFVLSEDEYARVAQAHRASGSRVVSVNNWMSSDLHRTISSVRDDGSIGAFERVELRTGRPDSAKGSAGWLPQWRIDPAHSGGGIILDHGWHQLYLLLAWMQEPILAVGATTRIGDPRHFPVEDEAALELQFKNGAGKIFLSWTAQDRSNEGSVQGRRGRIDIQDDRIVVHNDAGWRILPFSSRLTKSSYHPDWFEEMFRYNVLDESRAEADHNFLQAGVLVSIIGAAYRSAREGGRPQWPSLPEEVLAGT